MAGGEASLDDATMRSLFFAGCVEERPPSGAHERLEGEGPPHVSGDGAWWAPGGAYRADQYDGPTAASAEATGLLRATANRPDRVILVAALRRV